MICWDFKNSTRSAGERMFETCVPMHTPTNGSAAAEFCGAVTAVITTSFMVVIVRSVKKSGSGSGSGRAIEF